MPSALDPALLPEIDAALAHIGWMPSVPRDLVPSFRASGEASRRTNNRYVILMLTLMFDLYCPPSLILRRFSDSIPPTPTEMSRDCETTWPEEIHREAER